MIERTRKSATEFQAELAFGALVSQLRNGTLQSGAFLSIPVLVEQLDMPLASVREAVKKAEAAGLVTVLPKRGVMVMDAGPETTRECLELRAMFDCEGARRLIEQGTDISLTQLRDAHQAVLEAAKSNMTPELPRRAITTDLSLHNALSRGLGTRLAKRLYAENSDRIAIIQNTRPFLPDRIVSAMEEHLQIIAALEERDEDRAIAAIRHHLRNTLRWWGVAT